MLAVLHRPLPRCHYLPDSDWTMLITVLMLVHCHVRGHWRYGLGRLSVILLSLRELSRTTFNVCFREHTPRQQSHQTVDYVLPVKTPCQTLSVQELMGSNSQASGPAE